MNTVGEIFSRGANRLANLIANLFKMGLILALIAVGVGVVESAMEVGKGVEYGTAIVVITIIVLGVRRR